MKYIFDKEINENMREAGHVKSQVNGFEISIKLNNWGLGNQVIDVER